MANSNSASTAGTIFAEPLFTTARTSAMPPTSLVITRLSFMTLNT